jgi:hypothetical protein
MAREPRPVKRQVSFTAAEYATLRRHAKATRRPVARYVREVALGEVPHVPASRVDRALIGDLARVANNLNQLAREANSARAFPAEAKVEAILGALRAVIDRLAPVAPAHRGAGPFPAATDVAAAPDTGGAGGDEGAGT